MNGTPTPALVPLADMFNAAPRAASDVTPVVGDTTLTLRTTRPIAANAEVRAHCDTLCAASAVAIYSQYPPTPPPNNTCTHTQRVVACILWCIWRQIKRRARWRLRLRVAAESPECRRDRRHVAAGCARHWPSREGARVDGGARRPAAGGGRRRRRGGGGRSGGGGGDGTGGRGGGGRRRHAAFCERRVLRVRTHRRIQGGRTVAAMGGASGGPARNEVARRRRVRIAGDERQRIARTLWCLLWLTYSREGGGGQARTRECVKMHYRCSFQTVSREPSSTHSEITYDAHACCVRVRLHVVQLVARALSLAIAAYDAPQASDAASDAATAATADAAAACATLVATANDARRYNASSPLAITEPLCMAIAIRTGMDPLPPTTHRSGVLSRVSAHRTRHAPLNRHYCVCADERRLLERAMRHVASLQAAHAASAGGGGGVGGGGQRRRAK